LFPLDSETPSLRVLVGFLHLRYHPCFLVKTWRPRADSSRAPLLNCVRLPFPLRRRTHGNSPKRVFIPLQGLRLGIDSIGCVVPDTSVFRRLSLPAPTGSPPSFLIGIALQPLTDFFCLRREYDVTRMIRPCLGPPPFSYAPRAPWCRSPNADRPPPNDPFTFARYGPQWLPWTPEGEFVSCPRDSSTFRRTSFSRLFCSAVINALFHD